MCSGEYIMRLPDWCWSMFALLYFILGECITYIIFRRFNIHLYDIDGNDMGEGIFLLIGFIASMSLCLIIIIIGIIIVHIRNRYRLNNNYQSV